jgi:ABC-type amino acid transport system permease subunit
LASLIGSGRKAESVESLVIIGVLLGWVIGSLLAINTASSPPAAFRRPSDVVRQGVWHDLTLALVVGLVVGAPLILLVCLWPKYVIGMYLSYRQGRLPAKPARFLDWAYNAGLLRLSGGIVQFRHRELLDWLALK